MKMVVWTQIDRSIVWTGPKSDGGKIRLSAPRGEGNSQGNAKEGILYISLRAVEKGRQRKDDGKTCVTSVAIIMLL